MSQIILIENDNQLSDTLQKNLSNQTDAEIIPRKNAGEALEFLQMLPEVELIVSTDKIGNEKTASILLDYVRSQKNAPTLIVHGKAPEYETGELINVKDKGDWQQVIKVSCKLLGIPFKSQDDLTSADYVAIPIHYFYTIEDTPCDIFIKIKSSPSNVRFVKRINAGDSFTKEEIQRYEKQNLKEFYIPVDMSHNYSNFISNHFVSKLATKDLGEKEKMALLGEGHYIVTQEILKGGFTTATVQMTEALITSMLKTVVSIPHLNKLLLKVLKTDSGFIYQISHITCAISAACIQESSMPRDKSLFKKIAFASFFQDISLANNEKLAEIGSMQELEEGNFDESTQKKVISHAFENSKFVKQYPDIPYGADTLIKHHHGAIDGTGFSTDIAKLPEQSRILAVSSDFARLFLRFLDGGGHDDENKDNNILEALHKKYSSPGAMPTLRLLDKVIHKKKI